MAAIFGALANIPAMETTDNTNHLSVAMNGWVKDFADSTNGDWIDGSHPFVTDSGFNLSQTALTFNLHVPTLCPITAGHIAKSYLYDWYFRVHLGTYKLVLGNILSEQTRYVEIWNAWFNTETLSTVNNVGLSDLNIVLNQVHYDPYTNTTGYIPDTIPYTYNALETTRLVITAPATGTPALDGYFSFEFSTESPDLFVTGQRIILWTYNTLRKFTESRSYLTDVISSLSAEQTITTREVPRHTVEYDNIFLSNEEYTSAKQLATAIAHLAIGVPQWSEVVTVTNLVSGQTTILFDTTNLELVADAAIIFWKSWDIYEIAEILAVYANSIELKKGLLNSYTTCGIAPIIIGYTENGILLTQSDNKDLIGNLTVTSEYCYYNAIDSFTQFKGLPVWERTAVLSGGLQNKYSRSHEVSETPTGLISKFDLETYSRQVTKLSTYIKGRAELAAVRREFDFFAGRFKSFWLPTFKDDIEPLSVVNAGTSSLVVQFNNYSTYPIDYIYIRGKDGSDNVIGESFKITGALNNFNNTETLSFEDVAIKTFASITTVSILLKVRLDTDVITTEHHGSRKYTINLPVKEQAYV